MLAGAQEPPLSSSTMRRLQRDAEGGTALRRKNEYTVEQMLFTKQGKRINSCIGNIYFHMIATTVRHCGLVV